MLKKKPTLPAQANKAAVAATARAMPAQSNKGGAVRGQDRAAMVGKAKLPAQATAGMTRKPALPARAVAGVARKPAGRGR